MKINIKTLIAAIALLSAAAVGIFVVFSVWGKYWFRAEPKRSVAAVKLEKKPLQSRSALTTELCREKLNAVQDSAYQKIASHTQNADSSRFVLDGAGKGDFEIALNAFRGDHPEVFWFDTSADFSYYEYDDSLAVSLNFSAAGEELAKKRAALDEAVEAAAQGAPDNATDYDVELYLNDYLTKHCAYSPDASVKHTSYGALVEGKAVCDGYSHAFQLLCRRLGIECTVVEGTSEFNTSAEDGHMWNCVLLGDDWYHIDVTWNDSTDSACEAEHYFYVNLTEEQITRDHTISGDYSQRSDKGGKLFNVFVPVCDSAELNYCARNFVTIDNPDNDEQILAALTEAARAKSTFCAYYIDPDADMDKTCKSITESYAASWIQGANHFTGGNPKIAADGKVVLYESKRVLAILLRYE